MGRGMTCFINELAPKKALKRGSQLSCHKLKTSHFQSPKSLIMGWYTVTFPALVNYLLVRDDFSAVGGRKDSLHLPLLSPSWAKLLAFTLRRRALQCEPCTSKTLPHISPALMNTLASPPPHSCSDSVPLYLLPALK